MSVSLTPKTTDVLGRVGLSDRIINEEEISPSRLGNLMDAPIDYCAVDEIVKAEREKSTALLKAGIEKAVSQQDLGSGRSIND